MLHTVCTIVHSVHNEHLSILSEMDRCPFCPEWTVVHFVHFDCLSISLFSKFDVPVLLPSIIQYCKENELKLNPIEKHGKISYLTLKIEEDNLMQFRDVLSYTSPCSLDRYLKQWKTTQTKGFFPHG